MRRPILDVGQKRDIPIPIACAPMKRSNTTRGKR